MIYLNTLSVPYEGADHFTFTNHVVKNATGTIFDESDNTEASFEEETKSNENIRAQCIRYKDRKSKKSDSPKQEGRAKISKKNSLEIEGNFNIGP